MMVDYTRLDKALSQYTEEEEFDGQLGYALTAGNIQVLVDGDSTQFWCRFKGDYGKVLHRGRVAPIPHLHVKLGYEGDRVVVLRSNDIANKQYMGAAAGLAEGGMPRGRFMGAAPVDLRLIQQLGLRVVSGLEVKILPGIFLWQGQLYAWLDTSTVNFTSLVPATNPYQRWGIVGFDLSSGTPTLVTAGGTEQVITDDLTLDGLATAVNEQFLVNNYVPLCGVMLRYSQTQFAEADFEAIFVVATETTPATDDNLLWLHWGY